MSADNGVYILVTGIDKKEYRVTELQAVENFEYDEEAPNLGYCQDHNTISHKHDCRTCPKCVAYNNRYSSNNPDVHIRNARQMWAGCKVFTDKVEANEEAFRIYHNTIEDFGICEYGISEIHIPRDF